MTGRRVSREGDSCSFHRSICHPQQRQGIWRGQQQQPCLGPLWFATSPSHLATCQALQEGCWGKNRKRQLVCRVLEKIQLLPQELRLSWGRRICCCLCRQPVTAANVHWHWKDWSLLGNGLSRLVQPLRTRWRVTDCHRKEKWKQCYHAGIYPWWIEDELSVRKIKKEERKVTNH